jgi:SAM-dependent methyltransferase
MHQKLPRLVAPVLCSPMKQERDTLVAEDGTRYSIIGGIPRFVASDNYARAFGDQWLRFPKTQLDSFTGLKLSADRLARCLRQPLETLRGQLILEAGSGAGRFTEVLLAHDAEVDSFDYSKAVEANALNNGSNPALNLVQADIRRMPFPESSYDLVLCLGVVQHTPDPEESIRALWSRVRPGGRLVFDHYRAKFRNYLPPPLGVAGMIYRRYFLSIPKDQQFETVKRIFDCWFPIVWRYRDSALAQFVLSRLNPIVNYYPHFGLRNREMYYQWMLLDTHDAMTDVFKHRRTRGQIRDLLSSLGAEEIEVTYGGNGVEASCRKPE